MNLKLNLMHLRNFSYSGGQFLIESENNRIFEVSEPFQNESGLVTKRQFFQPIVLERKTFNVRSLLQVKNLGTFCVSNFRRRHKYEIIIV